MLQAFRKLENATDRWILFFFILLNWRFYVNSNNFRNFKRTCFTAEARYILLCDKSKAKEGLKMKTVFEWSFPKFENATVSIIFKCWYVFKLWLNWRFRVHSNNFGKFRKEKSTTWIESFYSNVSKYETRPVGLTFCHRACKKKMSNKN